MSKKENEQPEGDDYLEQLQWQSSFRGRWSSRFAPKWKYKIVYNNQKQTLFNRISNWLIVVFLVIFLFYSATSLISTGEYGLLIAVGSIILLIVAVLFFALRNVEKVDDNDDEDFE
ncbi:MAG TPA: hypothetical protein PLR65_05030 [Anaerolineales bacterium]|nr:hypothetical protein [Anaerolineales bacterium]